LYFFSVKPMAEGPEKPFYRLGLPPRPLPQDEKSAKSSPANKKGKDQQESGVPIGIVVITRYNNQFNSPPPGSFLTDL
jgi:hypothetical protein